LKRVAIMRRLALLNVEVDSFRHSLLDNPITRLMESELQQPLKYLAARPVAPTLTNRQKPLIYRRTIHGQSPQTDCNCTQGARDSESRALNSMSFFARVDFFSFSNRTGSGVATTIWIISEMVLITSARREVTSGSIPWDGSSRIRKSRL